MATSRRQTYRSKVTRLAELLAEDLASGHYAAGQMLPAETELGMRYSSSRMTMRKALDMLATRGLVRRLPHRGVQLLPRSEPAPTISTPSPSPATTWQRSGKPVLAAISASPPAEHLVLIREGIEEYARENDLSLRFISTAPEGAHHFDLLANVERLGVDGMVMLPYPGPEPVEALQRLWQSGFPIVCVEKRSDRVPLPSVEPDNASGMFKAVNYLIRKYHRPVYFLGLQFDHRNDAQRYEGYLCAMQDAGFADAEQTYTVLHDVHTGDPRYWQEERKWFHGYEVGCRLLARQPERPFCVACLKDDVAWGLYRAAEEHGLTVGVDLLVTGFDDLTIARLLKPPLTTIHQDPRNKGYHAAQLLHMNILKGHQDPVTVMLPVQLVERQSA